MGGFREISRIARSSLLVGPCAVTLVAVTLVATTQPAHAVGETFQERGRTVAIVDGDTIKVDIWGDGTHRPSTVRFTGVNSNEVGRCHAGAATARTRHLALGRLTRLYAIDVNAHSGQRLRRTVRTRQPNGSFRNLARTLVTQSLANASPIKDEWAQNAAYRAVQDRVQARHVRLWDRDACGSGPQQGIAPRVHVRWQGGFSEEYVDITNPSGTSLSLAGWYVRNASPSRFVFPRGARVPAGRTVRLHVRNGSRNGLHYFWDATGARFLNASFDARAYGNGAFLVDPGGDIRAFDVYP